MKKIIVQILVAVTLSIALVGCGSSSAQSTVPKSNYVSDNMLAENNENSLEWLSELFTSTNKLGYPGMDLKPSNIVDYGNNVYYFKGTEANFANMLSQFIGKHKNLEVSAMTGNVKHFGLGSIREPYQTENIGYFVTFKEKK